MRPNQTTPARGATSRTRGIRPFRTLALAAAVALALPLGHGRALAQTCAGPSAAPATGPVCGTTETVTVHDTARVTTVFRGIPYAKPPVGALRWQPPQDTAWTAMQVDTAFGSKCLQMENKHLVGSEDCLFLNVWMPPGATAGSSLPVMVFIHGGAFVLGAGSLPLYDGAYLAARGNVIVVTLNYRLGALGFLASNGVAGMTLTGNQGLKDQLKALQWVHDGIAAFGGDPGKVTLFGESAGAMSVGFHLFSVPASKGLFRAAIMESNPMGVEYRDLARANADGAAFLNDVCKAAGITASCLTAKALTNVSASAIMEASAAYSDPGPTLARLRSGGLTEGLPWTPVVDGDFVQGQPYRGYVAGTNVLPFIFGMNHDEGVMFAGVGEQKADFGLNVLTYDDALKAMFDPAGSRSDTTNEHRIVKYGNLRYWADVHVPVAGMRPVASALADVITDFAFACGNLAAANVADTATRAPARNDTSAAAPIFAYRFEQPPFFNLYPGVKECLPGGKDNVCHAYELPYVFHTLGYADSANAGGNPKPVTPSDVALSDSMVAAWARFATSPGASPAAGWAKYSPGGGLFTLGGSGNGAMQTGLASNSPAGANCSGLWYTLPPLNGTSARSSAPSVRHRVPAGRRTSATPPAPGH